ncbi:hypothetical protein CTU88_42145 [Streptomyces sp. JV178]|nr:hypothetical protein CTU88_42145 [Streptomyces sp. JV178]
MPPSSPGREHRDEDAAIDADCALTARPCPHPDGAAARMALGRTTGARAAGMAAAQRLIDEHGDFLNDLEQQLDALYGQQPGTAA